MKNLSIASTLCSLLVLGACSTSPSTGTGVTKVDLSATAQGAADLATGKAAVETELLKSIGLDALPTANVVTLESTARTSDEALDVVAAASGTTVVSKITANFAAAGVADGEFIVVYYEYTGGATDNKDVDITKAYAFKGAATSASLDKANILANAANEPAITGTVTADKLVTVANVVSKVYSKADGTLADGTRNGGTSLFATKSTATTVSALNLKASTANSGKYIAENITEAAGTQAAASVFTK